MTLADREAEWLEADGWGGFASGTVGLTRTRRYHALLLTATHPPTGRVVLVNGVEAWITTPQGPTALSSAFYAPGILHPDGQTRIAAFTAHPWPRWTFDLGQGVTADHEILVDPASRTTLLRWRCSAPATLTVRPLISGRDYHALHHENPAFDFEAATGPQSVTWHPYRSLPAITALGNFTYQHDPSWFREFLYVRERERGMDFTEDLASPGILTFHLQATPAILLLRAGTDPAGDPQSLAAHMEATESSRRAKQGAALPAAAYIVHRDEGATIMAGYPWFTDWGRDTFIALRGLLLATGQPDTALAILRAWATQVSQGMLPNRFADDGPPEYNTADASLWFVVAVHDVLATPTISAADRQTLQAAVDAVIAGHRAGTRFGIAMDTDGLLRAGEPGTQLTWMDARANGIAVTPRIGKPVEIQALWYNALRIAAAWNPALAPLAAQVQAAVRARFPNPANGGLFDVVDADHIPGAVDPSVRPNQIFAAGGLPFALLEGEPARAMVDLVQTRLLTPFGLRTLDPADSRYAPRYEGAPDQRDRAYHQGTVWPFLIGAFVEAWLRVHGDTPARRAEARTDFLAALARFLDNQGFGHLPEVADGDPPHTPGGCPFQAWSLGEFLRARAMTEEGKNVLF